MALLRESRRWRRNCSPARAGNSMWVGAALFPSSNWPAISRADSAHVLRARTWPPPYNLHRHGSIVRSACLTLIPGSLNPILEPRCHARLVSHFTALDSFSPHRASFPYGYRVVPRTVTPSLARIAKYLRLSALIRSLDNFRSKLAHFRRECYNFTEFEVLVFHGINQILRYYSRTVREEKGVRRGRGG